MWVYVYVCDSVWVFDNVYDSLCQCQYVGVVILCHSISDYVSLCQGLSAYVKVYMFE